jgi:putative transposase
MINEYERLNHSVWECKYHVVFIPKYRRKALFGAIKKELGIIFKDLARQKESTIEEGHVMPDHVHMLISIPPKYSVASVIGFIKGKSAIQIARRFRGKERNFTGEHFWARGYFASTVGRDEVRVREYIKNQEKEDARHEQLQLFQ